MPDWLRMLAPQFCFQQFSIFRFERSKVWTETTKYNPVSSLKPVDVLFIFGRDFVFEKKRQLPDVRESSSGSRLQPHEFDSVPWKMGWWRMEKTYLQNHYFGHLNGSLSPLPFYAVLVTVIFNWQNMAACNVAHWGGTLEIRVCTLRWHFRPAQLHEIWWWNEWREPKFDGRLETGTLKPLAHSLVNTAPCERWMFLIKNCWVSVIGSQKNKQEEWLETAEVGVALGREEDVFEKNSVMKS